MACAGLGRQACFHQIIRPQPLSIELDNSVREENGDFLAKEVAVLRRSNRPSKRTQAFFQAGEPGCFAATQHGGIFPMHML
jgi:hypothetical protein